jgi:hypothetical protein
MSKKPYIRIAWIFKFPRESAPTPHHEAKTLMVNMGDVIQDIQVTDLNDELPRWAQNPSLRRNLALGLIFTLLSFWVISVLASELSIIQYGLMALLWLGIFGVLNFTLRSLFDVKSELLDERLHQMRSATYEPAYYLAGILIFFIYFFNLETSVTFKGLLFAVITTYISIPYILLGLREKTLL